jgi:hypothetical protein
MISRLDLKTTVFTLLNVDAVLDYIGGKVYRGKSEDNNQLENIEILAGANVNDIAQDCTLFINYHVKDKLNGEPDELKMKELSDIIVPLLEASTDCTILDEQIFANRDHANWSYYSIRLMINALNDNFTE